MAKINILDFQVANIRIRTESMNVRNRQKRSNDRLKLCLFGTFVSIKNTLQLSASCSVLKICLTKKPFSIRKGTSRPPLSS